MKYWGSIQLLNDGVIFVQFIPLSVAEAKLQVGQAAEKAGVTLIQ